MWLNPAALLSGVLNCRALACKSWADRVPQCACGVPPRRIFERDVRPSAVVLGSLLHGCYMVSCGDVGHKSTVDGTYVSLCAKRQPNQTHYIPRVWAESAISSV
jgi:hypothetical protein